MLRNRWTVYTVAVVIMSTVAATEALAFQVFSNSRAAASARTPNARTATGTMSRATGNGVAAGLAGGVGNQRWSYQNPAPLYRSMNSRRATSSFGSANQSPVFHNYLPGTVNRSGTTTYRINPNRIQRRSGVASFSGPAYYNPYVPGYNGVAVGGVVVSGGRFGSHRHGGHGHGINPVFFIDPYAGQTFSPYAAGYPWVPGGQVPFGIYAPPITVPYLNIGPGVTGLPGVTSFSGTTTYPGGFATQNVMTESIGTVLANPPGALNPIPQPAAQNAISQAQVDEQPVVDEFPTAGPPTDTLESSAVDRIRSIRYQASGDVAFRDADFASAEALYRSAAKVAGERQAPWLRLMLSQIVQNEFPGAVQSLKAALNRNDDPTAAWAEAKLLTSESTRTEFSQSEERLFSWLKQRPNSADRLLLTAAFLEFRGSGSAAAELLQIAESVGLSQTLATNLRAVAQDSNQNQRPEDGDSPEILQPQPLDLPKVADPEAATHNKPLESFSDSDIQKLSSENQPQVPENPTPQPEPAEAKSENAQPPQSTSDALETPASVPAAGVGSDI